MRFERFKIKYREFISILKNEYKHIFSDAGVILVVIGAIFIYSFAYSLAYKNEVLRDIPIAVVDNSHSAMSRRLIRSFDASPNLNVTYQPTSLDEAKQLFFDREVFGVLAIPYDYEKKLMRNETVNVAVYADASYFLMYRQVFNDVSGSIMTSNAQIGWVRFVSQGVMPKQAEALSNPVLPASHNLFNPYGGYGTFLLPAILMVIIQQTLLIGIGMLGGTWRERRLYKSLIPYGEKRLSVFPLVTARSVAYISIYVVTLLYILGVHYKIFGYPMNGSFGTIAMFILPYLLSCIFLGIALASLFKRRENSLLLLLFSSIPCLILSGASIPPEAMPDWLLTIGKILPSSSGVDCFVRIQTMGASLSEVSHHIVTLWILTGVYFILACIGTRNVIRKAEQD